MHWRHCRGNKIFTITTTALATPTGRRRRFAAAAAVHINLIYYTLLRYYCYCAVEQYSQSCYQHVIAPPSAYATLFCAHIYLSVSPGFIWPSLRATRPQHPKRSEHSERESSRLLVLPDLCAPAVFGISNLTAMETWQTTAVFASVPHPPPHREINADLRFPRSFT